MHTILLLAAIYGTLNAQTNFVSAPPTVVVDGGVRVTVSITEPQANALGYKLLVDEPPQCASNEYAVATGYTEDERIRRVYEKRTIIPAPRRYSGWKMYKSIKAHGYGDAFDALMRSDVGVLIAFTRPQYFMEDDADFASMLASMCASLGITDAVRDEILSESVDREG